MATVPGRTPTFRAGLQPSLLDRLLDDEPSRQSEGVDRRAIGMETLRACVLRDLESLLNHAPLAQVEELEAFPRLRSSVLNYGFPNLLGASPRDDELEALRRQLRQVIVDFEPRIEKRSVQVEAIPGGQVGAPGTLMFRVTGLLWGQPLPTELQFQTLVDLSTGDAQVSETQERAPGKGAP